MVVRLTRYSHIGKISQGCAETWPTVAYSELELLYSSSIVFEWLGSRLVLKFTMIETWKTPRTNNKTDYATI